MITVDEKLRIKEIREKIESNQDVSKEDRQWILDMHKREKIPLPKDVFLGAKEMGFDVEGLVVKSGKKND